jgi:predicted dehydrogenase
MSEVIGVAFVGCAHPHIVPRVQILSTVPDVRLVGCYDPDTQLTATLASRHGLRVFSSEAELLDQPGVNFTIIEGWDTDNLRYARAALSRKQAILLEKPGAPNVRDLRTFLTAVRGAAVPFQVGYMMSFSPAIEHARQILESGALGHITMGRFHSPGPVGAGREPCLSVPGDQGGVVYADGAHMIDLIVRLLGVPRRVKAMLLKLPAGPNVLAEDFIKDSFTQETVEMPFGGVVHEDAGVALLEYADKLATFDMTAWGAQPWVESWTIELDGTDGTLSIGLQPPWYRLFLRRPMAGFEAGWHSWKGTGVTGYRNSLVPDANYWSEAEHMLARVRTWDTDNDRWIAEADAVLSIMDAIYESQRRQDAVDVQRDFLKQSAISN